VHIIIVLTSLKTYTANRARYHRTNSAEDINWKLCVLSSY